MQRVLIVDDEPEIAESLAGAMRRAGWEPTIAWEGINAILRVLDGGWDAVVMDVQMPRMNGVRALRIIRSVEPDLPVIMLTDKVENKVLQECNQLNAFACLPKTGEVGEILARLREALLVNTLSMQAA
jgi:two-component system, OmpR family, response regulator